ncbi:MAG TPA: fibronectin type III domain-containing protein, partial [Thermoanaerobaculia bacterium]|nr:fibronectin type III domain-containing protein [Thermoanaerobaculia bacterium]
GQVVLNWTAPSSDGGSPITSYTATCTDGTNAFTASTPDGNTTTVTVTGLSATTIYSCTVVAINVVGASASSTAASVSPLAPLAPALSPVALVALALLLVGFGSWRIGRP